MTRRLYKRLALLLLLAFSWQSVASPLLACCDVPTQQQSENSQNSQADNMARHQAHGMGVSMTMSAAYTGMNHADHSASSQNVTGEHINGTNCHCDCICEFCGVATVAMLESPDLQLLAITSPQNFRFNSAATLPLSENPFRPPIFA